MGETVSLATQRQTFRERLAALQVILISAS